MFVVVVNALFLLSAGLLLVRALGDRARFSWARGLRVALLGALAGAACMAAEKYVRALIAPGDVRVSAQEFPSLAALLLFFSPLEEGCKALLTRHLRPQPPTPWRAFVPLNAAWVAIGFAFAESLWEWHFGPQLGAAATLVSSLGHIFFVGAWAIVLGDHSRFWGVAWVAATVFHGLFTYLLTGRAQPAWVLLGPTLISAIGASWLGLRDLLKHPLLSADMDPLGDFVESVRVSALQERAHWRWIFGGAFVTVGVTLVSIALTVVLGRTLNVDFSVAEEPDARANVPIALLATGLAASFVVSGYLVARASGTTSVIEPAMAAAMALAFIVLMLSVTAPVASVVALAVAPAAFALACAGAWFGVAG